jgi:hypothetical protein
LVERDLAKVEVAGSSPVFRSKLIPTRRDFFSINGPVFRVFEVFTRVVELVDTQDLKSCSQ